MGKFDGKREETESQQEECLLHPPPSAVSEDAAHRHVVLDPVPPRRQQLPLSSKKDVVKLRPGRPSVHQLQPLKVTSDEPEPLPLVESEESANWIVPQGLECKDGLVATTMQQAVRSPITSPMISHSMSSPSSNGLSLSHGPHSGMLPQLSFRSFGSNALQRENSPSLLGTVMSPSNSEKALSTSPSSVSYGGAPSSPRRVPSSNTSPSSMRRRHSIRLSPKMRSKEEKLTNTGLTLLDRDGPSSIPHMKFRVRAQLYRQAFYLLDEDFSGKLEADEIQKFGEFMCPDSWDNERTLTFMREVDVNADGGLSFEEFVDFCEENINTNDDLSYTREMISGFLSMMQRQHAAVVAKWHLRAKKLDRRARITVIPCFLALIGGALFAPMDSVPWLFGDPAHKPHFVDLSKF